MNTNVDVNVLTRIPAMGVARVAAHQLDPEPADAVPRDVQREQPAMADLEAPVDPDQHRENQDVPEQFVQERRMDDFYELAGRYTVERIEHRRQLRRS